MDDRPLVRVEFYGVPRLRAGQAREVIRARTVSELVTGIAVACPLLAPLLADFGAARSPCLLVLNGREFVADPEQELVHGDVAILLSADAGG
jgi:hypothetical protein